MTVDKVTQSSGVRRWWPSFTCW